MTDLTYAEMPSLGDVLGEAEGPRGASYFCGGEVRPFPTWPERQVKLPVGADCGVRWDASLPDGVSESDFEQLVRWAEASREADVQLNSTAPAVARPPVRTWEAGDELVIGGITIEIVD